MNRTTEIAVAFGCGLLFAAGLVLSRMTDPAVVIAFLDVGGDWDPSLALVMVGALAVFAPAYRWSTRRARPALVAAFSRPEARRIDLPLIAGAAIFGVGWGASGYCPGPAVTSALTGGSGVLAFLGGMALGMLFIRAAASR